MVLQASSPAGTQDISALVAQLTETVSFLDSAVQAITELRAVFGLAPDPTGRIRILLDAITANLTLATITTVGTVTTVTTVSTVTAVTDITRMDAFGTSTFNNNAGMAPWNLLNQETNFNRSKITTN